jgi:hypothetical protein
MGEKILWFIAAIITALAVFVFLFVQRDGMTAGVLALMCLCFLNFRAQAPS